MRLMFTGGIVAALSLAAALLGGSAAIQTAEAARPVENFTENFHREAGVFYDVGLCDQGGVAWEISEIGNGVFHITEFSDGTFHVTGTFLGQVTIRAIDTPLIEGEDGFVPEDPDYGYLDDYPTYTGHYAQWFGENGNRQSANGTFTFNVHLVGSDGSRIQLHVVAHFNVTPDGVEHSFEIESCR